MIAQDLKPAIEAMLMASDQPLTIERLAKLLEEDTSAPPSRDQIREILVALQEEYAGRGVELMEVASGYRFQAKAAYAERVGRLWEERKPRYSRALLETLALIAYRQPITRGEIEHIRGVAVSSNIMRILLEREWVRVVGHRDVPGRPSVYATTKEFLDYFGMRSLEDLPPLAELTDIDHVSADLFASVVAEVSVPDEESETTVNSLDEAVHNEEVAMNESVTSEAEDVPVTHSAGGS
jgi:segregation and condensation protein B